MPYYKVISENKDLTFSPRIFSETEGLFQNEYRQVNKNSKHLADFSLKNKDSTSKTHFFSNSITKLNMSLFDISEIEMNLEATSDDNYLKTHNIKSVVNKFSNDVKNRSFPSSDHIYNMRPQIVRNSGK